MKSYFIQYYHLKKKEKLEENVGKETEWRQFLSGKEWEVFNDLSDFQQGVLELFANTEEPMPIHTVFQMLSRKQPKVYGKHTIQDAKAAVKILMGLGFFEKTIPEKVMLGESFLMDSREKPVTIQKYKSLLKKKTMKLEYLYLDGYKSLKKVSLSFKKQESSAFVNFLIGQNGSGKSSLLEAIG